METNINILVYSCNGDKCRNVIEPLIDLYIQDNKLLGKIVYCTACHSFCDFVEGGNYNIGDYYNDKDTLLFCEECKKIYVKEDKEHICSDSYTCIVHTKLRNKDDDDDELKKKYSELQKQYNDIYIEKDNITTLYREIRKKYHDLIVSRNNDDTDELQKKYEELEKEYKKMEKWKNNLMKGNECICNISNEITIANLRMQDDYDKVKRENCEIRIKYNELERQYNDLHITYRRDHERLKRDNDISIKQYSELQEQWRDLSKKCDIIDREHSCLMKQYNIMEKKYNAMCTDIDSCNLCNKKLVVKKDDKELIKYCDNEKCVKYGKCSVTYDDYKIHERCKECNNELYRRPFSTSLDIISCQNINCELLATTKIVIDRITEKELWKAQLI